MGSHARSDILSLGLSLGLCLVALVPACTQKDKSPVETLQADTTLAIEGAPAAIRIVTDSLGVRHIYSPSSAGVIFGQGYVTARDRFWQMDIMRRFITGRLSEYFGELALENDLKMRTIMMTRKGEFVEEALAAYVKNIDPVTYKRMQDYADGVNAWIADVQKDRNAARLPAEYDFVLISLEAADLAPWTVSDSLAIARLQAWSLSDSSDDEVEMLERKLALPADLFKDVFRYKPASPALTLGGEAGATAYKAQAARPTTQKEPRTAPTVGNRDLLPVLRSLGARNKVFRDTVPFGLKPGEDIGSNNWVVGPSLSADGVAMVANDPHLGLSNPPIWHAVQLNTVSQGATGDEAVNVSGVAFPGIPGVILGYNQDIAWGATVVGYDVADVYLETVTTPKNYPASPRTVLFKGKQVPVIRKEVVFKLPNGASRTLPIEIVPHHGPMMTDPDLDDDVDGLAATGMSVRWTGQEMSNDASFLFRMDRAHNVEEAKAALRYFAVGAQNWVIADRKGDIAYFPYALVPQRPVGIMPYLPVTGTGEAEWLTRADGSLDWLAEDKLPQALNPKEAFVATANSDIRGELQDNEPANDGIYLYADRAIGFRLERIQDMLTNKNGSERDADKITLQDMGRYQNDVYVKEAEYILPHLFAVADKTKTGEISDGASEALARLHTWMEQDDRPLQADSGMDPASVRDDIAPDGDRPLSEKQNARATAIFYAFYSRLLSNTLADEFAGTGIDYPSGSGATKALLHLLGDEGKTDTGSKIWSATATGASRLWDNISTPVTETRTQILMQSFEQGVADLTKFFASDKQDDWLWGKLHVVTFEHNLNAADVATYNLGRKPPFPENGARYTVNVANFGIGGAIEEQKVVGAGASRRFIVAMHADGPEAWDIIPGGENGDGTDEVGDLAYDTIKPDKHYGDWIPDWLRGKRFQYRFRDTEVADDAKQVWDIK